MLHRDFCDFSGSPTMNIMKMLPFLFYEAAGGRFVCQK